MMKKQITAVFCLVLCTVAVAEPVMYICERPTWGDDEGCGPNKTRYSYALLVDSDDFSSQETGSDSDTPMRNFMFAEARGCDLSRERGNTGQYFQTERGFLFQTNSWGREIDLHTDTMQAKLFGPGVRQNPYLTCTELRGEETQGLAGAIVLPYFQDPIQYPTSPTSNVNSDYSRQ